jgi:hypothetical protein
MRPILSTAAAGITALGPVPTRVMMVAPVSSIRLMIAV